MESLFEQMANITKAHAYDIVAKHRDELIEENNRLKEIIEDLLIKYYNSEWGKISKYIEKSQVDYTFDHIKKFKLENNC